MSFPFFVVSATIPQSRRVPAASYRQRQFPHAEREEYRWTRTARHNLVQRSVFGLLLRFSGPAIVGMMAQALYNLIDRVFVGHAIGADGIAGITVAFPFMLLMLAFGMLIGFGGAALISIRLGQQRKADAERILGNAAVLAGARSRR